MSCVEEIMERRKHSVFQSEYAKRGPEPVAKTGKCFCCGRTFDYPEALNRFEAYIEQRGGTFFAFDAFRDEICADCAIRTLNNSTWMEIL